MATKSDVPAKQVFIEHLKNLGFVEPQIMAQPADIMAKKGDETWYFEIKMTERKQGESYFGAATLTEWEQAFKTPETFRFVIARKIGDGEFEFKCYKPEDFMEYSTIPPFKIFFNVKLSDDNDAKKPKKKRTGENAAVRLTKDKFYELNKLFKKLKQS